jgi:hypothetical protein
LVRPDKVQQTASYQAMEIEELLDQAVEKAEIFNL